MSKKRFTAIVVASVALYLTQGCQKNAVIQENNDSFANPNRSHIVSAVSVPLFYITQQIAGDALTVQLIAPPNDSTPNTAQIKTLQESDLIIANGPGAPFAEWINRVSLPETKICNTTENLGLDDFISVKDYRIVHRHGPEGEHSHPFMVAETWLAPAIAKKQAEHIAQALATVYPSQATLFQNNLKQLNHELDSLNEQLTKVPAGQIITATPRLKFLTRAAGLEDTHLLWFEHPEEQTWAESGQPEFLKRVRQTQANQILFDTQPPQWLIEQLDELGYQVSVIQSFHQSPPPSEASPDYIKLMNENLNTLNRVISNSKSNSRPNSKSSQTENAR